MCEMMIAYLGANTYVRLGDRGIKFGRYNRNRDVGLGVVIITTVVSRIAVFRGQRKRRKEERTKDRGF